MAIKAVHHATQAEAKSAKPTKPLFEITLAIEGLRDAGGGLFTLATEQEPTNLDAGAIARSLEEQDVEPRVIDEALEAIHAVLHKDFVTKLFGKRVRVEQFERIDSIS